MDNLKRLASYLATCPPGPLADSKAVSSALCGAWDELHVDDHTSMKADKLKRLENPSWSPPFLTFQIERHGQTVNGSSRASVHTWQVDVDQGSALVIKETHRQVYAIDARLDVKPLAKRLAASILNETADEWLKRGKDGTVTLLINKIIPETNAQTTLSRRRRLNTALQQELAGSGWKSVRSNVFALEVKPESTGD